MAKWAWLVTFNVNALCLLPLPRNATLFFEIQKWEIIRLYFCDSHFLIGAEEESSLENLHWLWPSPTQLNSTSISILFFCCNVSWAIRFYCNGFPQFACAFSPTSFVSYSFDVIASVIIVINHSTLRINMNHKLDPCVALFVWPINIKAKNRIP